MISAEEKLNSIKSDLRFEVLNGCLDQGEMDEILSEYYLEDGRLYHLLDDMPYDRDGMHASGWEVYDEAYDKWWNQYFDENYEEHLLN